MKFKCKGLPLDDEGVDRVCGTLGVTDAEVWAILTVETNGFGFLKDRRPRILFERHKFHGFTNGIHDGGNPDVSDSKPGGYVGEEGEYIRLEKAMALDREAALQSASWGIGQVMGYHFKAAGYPTVEEMVADMVEDENSQLLAMANFIVASGLSGALQRCNWTAFARGYNGKNFKKNEYDTRLAAAHAKYRTILPDLALRSAQAALLYLGMNPGPIDGFRGRRTRSALIEFQGRVGLPATGELDGDTETRLTAEAFQFEQPMNVAS
jgi:hypothetical protein